MSLIQMPKADAMVMARRHAIVAGLSRALGQGTLVSDDGGLRAFETDAFTAYRSVPLAAVLPRSTGEVSRVLKFCSENQSQGHCPRSGNVAMRRCATRRGQHCHRPLAHERKSST